MRINLPIIRHALYVLPALFILAAFTHGQSRLFSIPTTDVLAKGSNYIEADFDTNLFHNSADRWQNFGATAVRGIGKGAEIGLNVYRVKTAEFRTGPTPAERQYQYLRQRVNRLRTRSEPSLICP